jgi:hypothetical protein
MHAAPLCAPPGICGYDDSCKGAGPNIFDNIYRVADAYLRLKKLRDIPTERRPLLGEVSANVFAGSGVVTWSG